MKTGGDADEMWWLEGEDGDRKGVRVVGEWNGFKVVAGEACRRTLQSKEIGIWRKVEGRQLS